jgi:predicted nucleotidyltransferase
MDYLDASTETELAAVATVLQAVQDRARTCGVDIMLVGAAARDILIRNVVGSHLNVPRGMSTSLSP